MKLIHTADWHFGYRQYGFREREQDFYAAGHYIAERAVALKVDGVIIAGDIFDMPKPPADAVIETQNIVSELTRNGIPVYGIDGNHDTVQGLWLKICGIIPLKTEPCVGPTDIAIAGIHALRPSVFNEAIDKLVEAGTHIDVLVIHQALGEFADFEAQEITAMEMAGRLAKIGVRYVAMGDIHDYHETVVGGIRFVYPGASEVNAIDESHDCSFSVVDITTDTLKTSYEPIPIRPIIETHLTEEKQLDQLLADITVPEGDRVPLAVVWYEPDVKELSKRAEKILRENNVLHRICPLSAAAKGTIAAQMARHSFERKGAMSQLKDAVQAFFADDSDQYELVFQLLAAPDSVTEIIRQYFESKGITVT